MKHVLLGPKSGKKYNRTNYKIWTLQLPCNGRRKEPDKPGLKSRIKHQLLRVIGREWEYVEQEIRIQLVLPRSRIKDVLRKVLDGVSGKYLVRK